MGRYGPDKDTAARTLGRRVAQQRQFAGAHKQCPAQQRQLAGTQEQLAGAQDQFVGTQEQPVGAAEQFAGAQEQFPAERSHTERAHVARRKALSEHEARFRFDTVTPEQATRCEVRFVRLAAVGRRRDADTDRCG